MEERLIKYFTGELTDEESKELMQQIDADDALKETFLRMQNLYGLTALHKQPTDVMDGMRRYRLFLKKSHRSAMLTSVRELMKYAAVAVVVLVSTLAIQHFTKDPEDLVAMEQIVIPAGQRAQVTLHDGTRVWMNAHSSLRFPNRFTKGNRQVMLEGEAYFEVAKNVEKPFIVVTKRMNVKVLGTKFNVFAYDNSEEFTTSLLEGSVKVYAPDQETQAITIEPNECLSLKDGVFYKSSLQDKNLLSWRDGIYVFDNATFADIVGKLELYYDVRILVNNAKLSQFRFSGKFRQRDGIESVLRTMQKVYYFTYTKDEDQRTITIR